MRLRQLVSAALVAAMVPAFGAGCGGSESKGTVTGEVTYAGVPLESGTIQFTPKDGKGTVSGGPVTAGKFNVPNVPVGTMVVSVTAGVPDTGPMTSEESARLSEERLKSKKPMAKALTISADASGNNETFDVKQGANTRNVTITPPRTR